MTPEVSIIITSYNYAQYLEECISSCLAQRGSYEIILVDDGSTDGTSEILRRYAGQLEIVRNSHNGLECACNLGLRLARGKHFVRVDADDRLKENYLAVVLSEMKNHPFTMIYSEYTQIDGSGRRIRDVRLPDFDPREIRQRGDFMATGTLYRTKEVRE